MGLWLLQESLRTWELEGTPGAPAGTADRRRRAAGRAARSSTPTTRRSCRPATCRHVSRPPARRSDQPAAARPVGLVRCILDSLAAAYGRAVRDAARLSGQTVEVVHLVGGGARNSLLCQLTADACEVPVLAGPVEATALGNVLVQARASGLWPAISRRCAPWSARHRTSAATSRAHRPSDRSADMPQTDLPIDELRAYRPHLTEPADLDAFWTTTLAETRAHPLDATSSRSERAVGHRDRGRVVPRLRRVTGPRLAPSARRARRTAPGDRRVHRIWRRPRPAARARPVGRRRLRTSRDGYPRAGLDLVDRGHPRRRGRWRSGSSGIHDPRHPRSG